MYNAVIARDEWNAKDIYAAKVRNISVKKCRQCAEKMRLEVTSDDKEIFKEKMLRRVREQFTSEAENSVKQANPSNLNNQSIKKDVDALVAVFRNIFMEKISAFSESDYLAGNDQKMLFEGLNLVNREERFQIAVNEFRTKYPFGQPQNQESGNVPIGCLVTLVIIAVAALIIFGS